MRKLICIILLFLPFWAQAKIITIHQNVATLSLDKHAHISTDEYHENQLTDLYSGTWKPATESNIGVAKQVYWIRYNFLNTSTKPTERYFYLPHHILSKIDLYQGTLDSVWHVKSTGTKRSYKDKDIEAIGYPIKISIPLGASQVFLRLEHLNEPVRASAFLLSESEMQHTLGKTQSTIWFWRGIFTLALLFSIVLYFATNFQLFLYYFLLNIGVAFFIGTEVGDFFLYFNVDLYDTIMDLQRFGVILVLFYFPLFLNELTPIKKPNAVLWKILYAGIYFIPILWFICLFPFAKNSWILRFTTYYFIYFSAFHFLTQLYFTLRATIKKEKNALALLIVYSLYIGAVFINVTLPNLGEIRDTLYVYNVLMIGSIIEIITFLFIMGRELIQVFQERNDLIVQHKDHQIEMIKAIIDSQEVERNKVGSELHDLIGANISVIKQNIDKHNSALVKLIDSTVNSVRRLSHGLMTPLLKNEDFEDEIKDLCLLATSEELNVQFYFHNWPVINDQNTNTHLYRITQELLQNTIKHSQASKVYIQFIKNPEGLSVMFEDNGIGLELKKSIKLGRGLYGIQNRVKLLSGYINIDSYPNKGLNISIMIPIKL